MKSTEFLKELQLPKNKWEVLLSTHDKEDAGDELVDLVQTAYSNTPDGSFVNSIRDVIPSDWLVIDHDENPDVDATIFYRGPRQGESWSEYKIQGMGHDGTKTSKQYVLTELQKLLNKSGWWLEGSDAMRHVLKKMSVPVVDDERTLNALFPNSNLSMIDDHSYTRLLPNGKKFTKLCLGTQL